MSISPLTGSSTFFDWYTKTNDEIIAQLNAMKIYDAESGDGVKLDVNLSTNILTATIGGTSGNITSGLTFSGKVSFTGEVVVPNVSFKITGITSGTSGYTFGSVIRLDGTGYTTAQANDPDNAESLGVLSAINSNYSVVTVLGLIGGNFQTVAGGTLSPGCVYFISPTTPGYITDAEPVTVGQVSKPIILGVTETSGLVVQYRGNYLNGASTLGLSGNNRLYVILPSSSSSNGFDTGNFISYVPNVGTKGVSFDDYLTNTGRTAYDGWFVSTATSNDYISPLPFEEDFVVGMIETSSAYGSDVLYQVVTHGVSEAIPSTVTPGTYGWWHLSGTTLPNQLTLSSNNIEEQNTNERLYVGYNYNDTSFVVNIKPQIRAIANPSSTRIAAITESFSTISNETFNGDFEIWQRTTGRVSPNTSSGSFYFADQWVKRQGNIPSGSSQYIEKQNFSNSQILVEGSPKHYVDFKCLADHAGISFTNHYASIGHIIPEIETLNNTDITVSFYSKATQTGYSVDLYFARYSGGSLVEKDIIATFDPTTTWNKFTYNYTVPELAAGSYSDDYVEIGFDLAPLVDEAYDNSVPSGTGLYASFASLCVYKGTYANPKHVYATKENKLNEAKQFYYTTYTESQTPELQTLASDGGIALNALTFMTTPTVNYTTQQFSVEMSKDPTITVYSPKTGLVNEVHNSSANQDLRNTTGTIGYGPKSRIAPLGVPTYSILSDKVGYKLTALQGTVPFDVLSYHIVADATYTI